MRRLFLFCAFASLTMPERRTVNPKVDCYLSASSKVSGRVVPMVSGRKTAVRPANVERLLLSRDRLVFLRDPLILIVFFCISNYKRNCLRDS